MEEQYIIFDINTNKIRKKYSSLRVAKAAFSRMKLDDKVYAICSYLDWNKNDILVPVVNFMTGNIVMVRRSELGGCCDPSTELYWSM